MWKVRNREKGMVIYANICKQSPNEFLKTLIIKVHYKTQISAEVCDFQSSPPPKRHSQIPLSFAQSISVSFLKSILKCISQNHFRQLPQLSLAYQLCSHISLLAFRRSERPKVHRINCR